MKIIRRTLKRCVSSQGEGLIHLLYAHTGTRLIFVKSAITAKAIFIASSYPTTVGGVFFVNILMDFQ
jgi:hypothetical protein